MSVDCVNALDKVDYTLLMTICPRFVCLSRVSLVADMLRCRGFDLLLELGHRAGGAEKRHLERRRRVSTDTMKVRSCSLLLAVDG